MPVERSIESVDHVVRQPSAATRPGVTGSTALIMLPGREPPMSCR
jgi:hypothetical protein